MNWLRKLFGRKPAATAKSKWPTYVISDDGRSISCHYCGLTSFHPEDVRHRFCGFCNRFHETGEAR